MSRDPSSTNERYVDAPEVDDQHLDEPEFDETDGGGMPSKNRLAQIVLGVFLIIVGIPMIPLTGPGWAVILVGLNMVWPGNPVVPWLRRHLPVVPDEGPIPKRYYVIGGLLMVVGIVVSILYGSDITRWLRDVTGI